MIGFLVLQVINDTAKVMQCSQKVTTELWKNKF